MTLRRNVFVAAALLLALFVAPAAPARAQNDPGQFIAGTAERAISVLKQADLNEQQREQRFREIFQQSFDAPTIGRYVLGVHWRSATEQQRADYLSAFTGFIVKTYAERLRDYSGQQVKVGKTNQYDDKFMVESEIVGGGKAPIRAAWQVEKRDSGLKITDVVIEGVSLGLTQRSDFSSYINQNGGKLDALIAELKRRGGG